jgi:branched-chain amino acid transport system permease protein
MTVLVDASLGSIVGISIGFLYRHLGLISLGQTAFYGSSAYTMAILNTKFGWSLMSSALVGIGVGVVLAAIIGVLVMRSKGIAFLMLTMALGLAIYNLVLMEWARPITGAHDGLILVPKADEHFLWLTAAKAMNDRSFWPITWSVLVIAVFMLWTIGRSRFGTVLHGIRENEERMRFSGFNTLIPRFFAFVIAGAVASIAGVLTVANSGLVTDQTLSFGTSSHQLVATIVGGMGITIGPIVGAFIFTFLQSFFSTAGGMDFFMGGTLVIVLAFMRGGIVGGIEQGIRWLRKRAPRSGKNEGQE